MEKMTLQKRLNSLNPIANIINAMTVEALIKQAGGSIPKSMVVDIMKLVVRVKSLW